MLFQSISSKPHAIAIPVEIIKAYIELIEKAAKRQTYLNGLVCLVLKNIAQIIKNNENNEYGLQIMPYWYSIKYVNGKVRRTIFGNGDLKIISHALNIIKIVLGIFRHNSGLMLNTEKHLIIKCQRGGCPS